MAVMSTREPKNEEDRIQAIMVLYGVGRSDAKFIMAIEDGEIDGDVVDVSHEDEADG